MEHNLDSHDVSQHGDVHPQLSIVVPFLNEETSLPLLKKRFCELEGLPEEWELIFVSDGSTDRSVEIIERWAAEDMRVKLVVLARNFGHQPAVCAGLSYAQGQFVGIMDADLQDPPEVLLQMYCEARAGNCDVVYSVRSRRSGSAIKKLAYRLFYKVYAYLAQSPVNMDSGDFSVLSRRAVNTLLLLPEKTRFVRGLRSWIGLRQKAIPTVRPERAAGEPQYSWMKLFALALSGVTAFSTKPLRIATISGLLMCAAAVMLSTLYLIVALIGNLHEKVPGFTTIVILILFLNGLQFLMIGILGEYIGQIFQEVKQRPTYLVDRVINMK